MFENIKTKVQNNHCIKTRDELTPIWDTVWLLILCEDIESINWKRAIMYSHFDTAEQKYYKTNWLSKEPQSLLAYTRELPNLGLGSSSHNESQNLVMQMFVNNTMNLEQAVRQLCRTIEQQDLGDEQWDAQSCIK